jgi:Potential Queuosine, Q, salvage protein family
MAPLRAPAGLCAAVREHCAAVAHSARWVRIDRDASIEPGGVSGLDADLHYLDAGPEEIARYVLVLDATNFGSGWFDTLRLPAGESGTSAITRALTAHARSRGGTWTAAELRDIDAATIAGVLGQDPAHELMGLYAEALRQLGGWLGDRGALDAIADAEGSAQRFAELLALGMPFFDDIGFYKRAQITANDLVLAGVAPFADADVLTVFADNLVPHVLRHSGVLEYAPELAALVDAGEPLAAGSPMEREIRGCAVHACELLADRLGVAPRLLDNWLWNRGDRPPFSELPAHRTRTVFY